MLSRKTWGYQEWVTANNRDIFGFTSLPLMIFDVNHENASHSVIGRLKNLSQRIFTESSFLNTSQYAIIPRKCIIMDSLTNQRNEFQRCNYNLTDVCFFESKHKGAPSSLSSKLSYWYPDNLNWRHRNTKKSAEANFECSTLTVNHFLSFLAETSMYWLWQEEIKARSRDVSRDASRDSFLPSCWKQRDYLWISESEKKFKQNLSLRKQINREISKYHSEFAFIWGLISQAEILTLLIPGFFGWCSTGGGRCFPPTPFNSFVFKVRRLKFCVELVWGRTNVLRQEKSGSNRHWRHYDVILALMNIENC